MERDQIDAVLLSFLERKRVSSPLQHVMQAFVISNRRPLCQLDERAFEDLLQVTWHRLLAIPGISNVAVVIMGGGSGLFIPLRLLPVIEEALADVLDYFLSEAGYIADSPETKTFKSLIGSIPGLGDGDTGVSSTQP